MSVRANAIRTVGRAGEGAGELPALPSFGHGGPGGLSELSVIIPAYNEHEGICDTLETLRRHCSAAEVIVIDDGSQDGTAELARRVEGVRVISHTRNRGYGAALKTGIRNSTRRYIAWYDADGQHRPSDLISVARAVADGPADVAIGVRGRESAVQRERRTGKKVLALVARLVSGEQIPDLNSGLRCFRREVILRYLHLLPDTFSASTTSTLMMMKRGYRIAYVPIVAQPRVGKSTVKIVSDGVRTLQLIVRIVVLFEAFKVFSALGAALFVPGLIYGLIVALINGQGFPTLAGTAVISGILTFFMGIVADQVAELRKERFEVALNGTNPSMQDAHEHVMEQMA
ncbi:MAG: Undecaprenyl-phosphate 4-deoxy-4-formamido-L-arabinose transferase [Phycisphaerae bacterium]|nr:Undecaprenyl-phosphate 4-deoxy-4-formamido-L-arabinose transferase [Phycisphaerae bacterium]